MDINTILIVFLLLPFLYGVYMYYTQPEWIVPKMPKALWGEQVGKSKLIQSKTGDASLFIEKSRRVANRTGGFQKGFMSAAIDYFFISSLCPCTKIPVERCKCKCCDVIDGGSGVAYTYYDLYDGGNVGTEFSDCAIDGGKVIHGQNCSCCPQVDGGSDAAYIYSDLYDGGNVAIELSGCPIDGGKVIHGQTCSCCPQTDGGSGVAYIYTDIYDGGNVAIEFSNYGIDGGAVVHGQNCSCCPQADGGKGTDTLDVIYSAGNANTKYVGSNLDGGNV